MSHTLKLSLLAVGASLLIAACGSSSKSSTASASTKAPSAKTTATSSSSSEAYGYGAESKKASTSSATASVSGAAEVSTLKTGLGTILVAANGHTLYLFEGDKNGKSNCKGDCAGSWPPLMSSGKPKAGSGVNASLLGLTTREEGGTQVTYNGHPLYEFIADKERGQTSGEGLKAYGAAWYVVSPAGSAIK